MTEYEVIKRVFEQWDFIIVIDDIGGIGLARVIGFDDLNKLIHVEYNEKKWVDSGEILISPGDILTAIERKKL